jgi:WD40 repeat protein/DNA-directed RNA polymerase subunit RPC12/RpoP
MTKKRRRKKKQPLAVLEQKIKGHRRWVRSVAVSPDGKWAVSGSDDHTVKIWDLESGRCRQTLREHKGGVRSVAITPDGTRILSASNDRTIRAWDADTGRHMSAWTGHTDLVLSIVVLPDGKRALSGSFDQTLKLWDIETGQCLKTIRHDASIWGVAVTGNGRQAVSGDMSGVITHWDLEIGGNLANLKGHTDRVKSVQITPDGRRAVSGSNDKTVKLWDLETGTCMGTFEGHQTNVYSTAISPYGMLMASTGFLDKTLRIWDLNSGACLQVIKDEESYFAPISVTFSPDGSRLVAGTTKGEIYIYRLTGVKATVPVEAGERYTNAKVVLVGESGVGKSGLAHRLIDDKFVHTHSTHGMQVWPLDLPIEKKQGMEREALLWDLAGQDDYKLVHQLFLDETALALMLINPQKDDPFAEAGDWLKILNASTALSDHGREAVKLLIAARTDVGTVKVSQKKIDAFMKKHGFAGYLPTSAKTGENCSDGQSKNQRSALKELITEHIPWSTLPWTSSPRLLRELKKAVLTMKDEKNAGLLRFTELTERLKQKLPKETFNEGDVRTAVTLLANHGLVMPFEFGGLVLLKPELLNGYASAVIRAARTHIDEIGCTAEDDVFNRKISFDGVDRLRDADEQLMLRAMVQTFLDKSLCIAEETTEGKQLIFPSQYRRERPIPGHPEICVSYTFTGETATVYTTLVVRLWYGRGFDNKELWRNAAEFTTSKNQTAGLLLKRTGEGEGTICVFFEREVPDELKVVFIEYVHKHLHKYARDVRRERRYVCLSCGKRVLDTETVRERLEAGKKFIYCQKCDEKVLLIDHIEQRLGTDKVARKVYDMDEKASQELDNQAREQILLGHMMAICGEANHIFRPVSMFDMGIDGEVEFRGADGKATGKRIYVQLKSGPSHLRERKRDETLIFDVKNPRHLDYWQNQPADVYLVIRDAQEEIRWMNITKYLETCKDKTCKQIVFDGETLDAPAIKRAGTRFIASETII